MRAPALLLLLALAGCSGGGSAPKPAQAAPPPAELTSGDLHLRAVAVPTLQLPEGVARGYGIDRGEHRVLLLVALRTGPEGADTAVAARVEAGATDLQGRRIEIPMRELRTADPSAGTGEFLIDYIGVFDVTPPDTLRFEVDVVAAGKAPMRLDFVREFPP